MAFMFRKMVIAGVGLIGGSMALAARERGLVDSAAAAVILQWYLDSQPNT